MIEYPKQYKLTDEAIKRVYPDKKDELGNIEINYNLRYCYAEPDKSMNGEFWLMDENRIVNPNKYTEILSESDLIV